MKKLLVIGFALIAFCSIAFARPLTVRVNIPFAFHAGDTVLPAGEYEIASIYMSALILRRMDGGDSVFAPTNQVDRLKDTPADSITFNRYGDDYFMVALNSGDFKVKLPKTNAEKKLAGDEFKGTVIAYLIK
jgi:hypothetical protein